MKTENRLFEHINGGAFVVTAEYLPRAEAQGSAIRNVLTFLKEVPTAVNVSDNPFGVVMSSLASSYILAQSGIEPVCQIVTRDRNRIAIQSDLLGASSLGINNLLCLSGYHQTLTENTESANVYDIDSTQLIDMVRKMREYGELQNGAGIEGSFTMSTGAAANPFLKPLELNMIRLRQKVEAGASFIQTQAVFNIEEFKNWLDAAGESAIPEKTAILAGVFPLESVEEAEYLCGKYTEFQIPAAVINRLKSAGDKQAQKKEGVAICVETIDKIKSLKGLRGIHILSGGKEETIPEILNASGLSARR